MNMKKRIYKLFLLGMMFTIFKYGIVEANTTYNIDYNMHYKYDIILDGETFNVPEKVTYEDDVEIELDALHGMLDRWNSTSLQFEDGILSINAPFHTFLSDEYVAIFNKMGIKDASMNMELLEKLYKVNYVLYSKNYTLEQSKIALETETDQDKIDYLNERITILQEQVDELKEISIGTIEKKEVISAIPFLSQSVHSVSKKEDDSDEIIEDHTVNYYAYSIICRDMRLENINYSINGQKQTLVPKYNKDTYEYNISLPNVVEKDSTITTNSELFMDKVLEYNNISDYNLDMEIKEANVQLVNGVGTATVKVILDTSKYPNDRFPSKIERSYVLNFEVQDYLKGDMNKDGMVDTIDSAIVLTKYKANSTTSEDLVIGDMNNDGVLDAIDAAMIATIYRNN